MKIILTENQQNRLVEYQELDEGILNTIGDVMGIFDPTGIIDIVNSISYWKQGKKTFALLSLLSAIPGADFVTKPFVLGGKIIGSASQTKMYGWLIRTFDKWIGLILLKIDKLVLSKIPIVKNFANGIKTFILSLKKDSLKKP